MNNLIVNNATDILIWNAEDGKTKIDVKLLDETVWLTQAQMAELFDKARSTITEHVNNIFEEGELDKDSVCRKFRHTAPDGKPYEVMFYNLDVVISVGYRVKSHRGTQFRKWATERLREYMVKGFVMDDDRLKEGKNFGQDYFDELLDRIRDIRNSEKRLYQKVKEIYALSADYEANLEDTKKFFQIVQNKLHFAITDKTAAEIIAARADAKKPNMGLTSWKGAKPRSTDVIVAKNYLNEEEISQLNLIVNMYLDYAELQTKNKKAIYMKDWVDKLNAFLQFNEKEILHNAGKVQMEVAKKLALGEFAKFNQARIKEEDKQAEEEAKTLDALQDVAKKISKTTKAKKKKA